MSIKINKGKIMIKRTLLAASILAAASTTAFAGYNMMNTSSWYVSVLGTIAIMPDTDSSDGVDSLDLETDTGYGGALAIGKKFDRFRIEGEVGYIRNDADELTLSAITPVGSFSTTITGHVSVIPVMVNAYYDFDQFSTQIVPYIGVGAGYLYMDEKVSVSGITDLEAENHFFAYQVIAGIGIHPTQNTTIAIDYRYLATNEDDIDITSSTGASGSVEEKYENHLVNLVLSYQFA